MSVSDRESINEPLSLFKVFSEEDVEEEAWDEVEDDAIGPSDIACRKGRVEPLLDRVFAPF